MFQECNLLSISSKLSFLTWNVAWWIKRDERPALLKFRTSHPNTVHTLTICFRSTSILFYYLCLGLTNAVFLLCFPVKTSHPVRPRLQDNKPTVTGSLQQALPSPRCRFRNSVQFLASAHKHCSNFPPRLTTGQFTWLWRQTRSRSSLQNT